MSIYSQNRKKKYRSEEVASNKLEKGLLRDYETGFCAPLALKVLEKKIFKDLAMFLGFSYVFQV
jgi:hypothetical protein